jgi:hypothetical protein
MLSKKFDLLDGLVEIWIQSSRQLHLISEAPDVVTISCEHHDSFSSFLGMAWEVAVL